MTILRQCLILLSLLLSMVSISVFAEVGGGSESGGGGGDPRATEFLAFAGSIKSLISARPEAYQEIDLGLLTREISAHRDSLATLQPTLQFLPVDALDCFNAAKAGCTRSNGAIDIAANYWDRASELDRCILTAQELFVHQAGIQGTRYSAARFICQQIINPESITKRVVECMADQSSIRYCEYINHAVCEISAGKIKCEARESAADQPTSI